MLLKLKLNLRHVRKCHCIHGCWYVILNDSIFLWLENENMSLKLELNLRYEKMSLHPCSLACNT